MMLSKIISLTTVVILVATCINITAYADMDLETGAAVSGIAVALNNYYARSMEPEKALSQSVQMVANGTIVVNTEVSGDAAKKLVEAVETVAEVVPQEEYQDIAISKISDCVNIRTESNTKSSTVGKIYNNSAAKILETVDGEDGKWYKIQSGNVTGFIKAEYFYTGKEAEDVAKNVGTTYGTVGNTSSLRLREEPNASAATLTLLAEGATYEVVGQEGEYLKVKVDEDLTGYVFKDYMSTSVKYAKAISTEDEAASKAEENKLKQEAQDAIVKLDEVKKVADQTNETTKKSETTKAEESSAKLTAEVKVPELSLAESVSNEIETKVVGTLLAETTEKITTIAETTKKATTAEETTAKGPKVSTSSGSSAVISATRTAIVAYAKQFIGNPYVFGGTSLTDGTDCSGFTMQIYSHFGYSIGRSSRDQAANVGTITESELEPGDLLFYASGSYINHVAMYIGDGKIIHASTPATGITTTQYNYRTPCKIGSVLY